MVLFTPKKLTFKRSKKQHQILAQTAYYQAGKIVVQTILPEQPPVALITLNTLGTTCSTSADTYIPIENIFNTQSCSFLESRLVSLYGGKAASLLIEYQQRLNPLQVANPHISFPHTQAKSSSLNPLQVQIGDLSEDLDTPSLLGTTLSGSSTRRGTSSAAYPMLRKRVTEGSVQGNDYVNEMCGLATCKGLKSNCVNEVKTDSKASAYNRKTKLINNVTECRTYFAGTGNNIFQSTLGNIEIQTATRLARIMVNYWNFYSLNKSSLYSIFKKDAPVYQLNALHSKASINSITKLANFPFRKNPPASARVNPRAFASVNPFANTRVNHYLPHTNLRFVRGLQQRNVGSNKQLSYCAYPFRSMQNPLRVTVPRRGNPHISFPLGYPDKSSDKSPSLNPFAKHGVNSATCKGLRNNLYFAIAQSKNSLKICESSGTSNSSYTIQRLSMENIGNYSQLNNNNFQLINSLQFSNLQRDRFYPNWFRLYLPDMEATEFLKNVANYYFSLGLQTFTFPSTKFSYYSNAYPHTYYKSKICTPARNVVCGGSDCAYPIQIEDLSRGMQSPSGVTVPRFNFGKLGVSIASPFLTFLNKNTQKEKFIPTIISYTYCPPSILINEMQQQKEAEFYEAGNFTLQAPGIMGVDSIKNPNFTKVKRMSETHTSVTPLGQLLCLPLQGYAKPHTDPLQVQIEDLSEDLYGVSKSSDKSSSLNSFAKHGVSSATCKGYSVTAWGYPGGKGYNYPLNVPFSLLLENQIFPLNYNGFSTVEKELLYNALVNSSFAKAFYLINQNRQLLDFLVDYLLRFQILRQHQILYLFSTLLLGCNKTA